MNNLKSRKFIITVLVLLLSFGLVITKQLESKMWFEWAVGLVAAYGIINVASEKVSK
ncbi:MAG: hypothetical protein WC241_04610 [Candidatus Paceibacterota bacterium]|jgi:uncharacterized membrane-anchored protein YjiN (DUF445 family)